MKGEDAVGVPKEGVDAVVVVAVVPNTCVEPNDVEPLNANGDVCAAGAPNDGDFTFAVKLKGLVCAVDCDALAGALLLNWNAVVVVVVAVVAGKEKADGVIDAVKLNGDCLLPSPNAALGPKVNGDAVLAVAAVLDAPNVKRLCVAGVAVTAAVAATEPPN